MTEKIALRVQHKRMTKEDWLKSDAILLEGEIGVESNTGYIKAGNGTDYFPDLPYLSGPPGIIVKGQFDYLEDLKNTYPTGNFGEGYQIKNEDKTVYAWGERHATKSASGNAITLEDSATANLRGLRLYGRSWQEGEPSIEDPKTIYSTNNFGVGIYKDNLLDLRVFRSNKSVDFEEGKLVWKFKKDASRIQTIFKNLPKKDVYFTVKYTGNTDCVSLMGSTPHDGMVYLKTRLDNGTHKIRIPQTISSLMVYLESDLPNGTVLTFEKMTLSYQEDSDNEFTRQYVALPYELNAVPVDDGGNYIDADGQNWVADYIDFDRGVLVRNVIKKTTPLSMEHINDGGWYIYDNWCSPVGYVVGDKNSFNAICNVGAVWSGWLWSGKNLQMKVKNGFGNIAKQTSITLLVGLDENKHNLEPIPLSKDELAAYAEMHTAHPHTTIISTKNSYTEVDYQSMEVEGEWLDVGKFHTDTNDVTQLQSDMLMKANKRDLVDDVPRINELEGKIKELSSKIDRIVANGT